MSPKKYLSLDEAAQQLGLRNDELNRMREKGEIRGFADRGMWKFKVEDVEELGRSRQADSSPEVPMFIESDPEIELSPVGESGSNDPFDFLEVSDSDSGAASDSAMVIDDITADEVDDPTVIRKAIDPLSSSDSDVRLVFDEPITFDAPEPTAPASQMESDSDIRLVGELAPEMQSDSDVKLVGEFADFDEEVKLVAESDSDSDVKLVGESDSDSDVKLVGDDTLSDVALAQNIDAMKGSDSDIRLLPTESDQPVIVTAGGQKSDSNIRIDQNLDSDSDVNLVGSLGTDSDVKLVGDLDSDSDIKLVGDDTISDISLARNIADQKGSDSEIRLLPPESDSDIKLIGDSPIGDSDSEVKLVAPEASGDSDVKILHGLDASDSDVQLLGPADSSIALDFEPDDSESASVLSEESGISLGGDSAMMLATESGFSLEGPSDSGISLSAESDEGITLDTSPNDSGISLEAASNDSGISLGASDSGISLSLGDSGISLESVGDSGISLEDSQDFGGTIPMMDVAKDLDSVPETKFEIPSIKNDDSAFELRIDHEEPSGDSTQVLNLQDSGEATLDDAVFDVDDDDSDSMMSGDDDLEVSDDAFADDDEDLEEMEVFGADDDAFSDDDDAGAARPMRAAGGVAYEHEWGMGVIAGLSVTTLLMGLCMFLMFDLVKTMWVSQPGTPVASALLDTLGGMF